MLINCPECKLQVSDKAYTCPHCGYSLKKTSTIPVSNKRKRLPNGFGQISLIKGKNLRNPYRAMVSTGTNSKGRPICKLLQPTAYFKTYNEAYEALLEYNKNPYDLDKKNITFEELFHEWYAKQNLSHSMKNITLTAFKYSIGLYKMPVISIKVRHLKEYIEGANAPTSIKPRMKFLYNQLFDYAVEYEIIDRNPARAFTIDKKIKECIESEKSEHINYSDEEMDLIWKHHDKYEALDILLVQCYGGWRPVEVVSIENKNIDLKNGFITGGVKTKAGKNRLVPIHSKIRPIIEKYHRENFQFLFDMHDYFQYNVKMRQALKEIGISKEHRPHDGRVHFITAAKEACMDEYAIKYIVGHAIEDITEKVYTKRQLDWLKTEIEKI